MLPSGTPMLPTPSRSLRPTRAASAPGTAREGSRFHLDFGAQALPRVVTCSLPPAPAPRRAVPLRHRALLGPWRGWSCHIESHGLHCTAQGAAGACEMMLPRTSSSKNTSKPVLMAASKQEGRERQTWLLATVGGEKQLTLQAGEGLPPSQLQSPGEMCQMSQMSQMGQKGSGPPAPNAARCVAAGG